MGSKGLLRSAVSRWALAIFFALFVNTFVLIPVFCQDEHMIVDWSKIALNAQQSQQVKELDEQWRRDYGQLKPAIADDQRKISKLLGEHDSDQVEIMSVQASLARKREQLSALAMANYLKKRQVLNESQKRTLENMMRQAIAEHEQSLAVGSEAEPGPDHIQGLMQRVRNAWTVQGEH
jgi:Spy/CpxP family protein refolding chaperone